MHEQGRGPWCWNVFSRDALGSLPAPCLHLCTDAWAFPWKITCLQSFWEDVALFFHLLLPGKQQVGLSEL